MKKEIFKLRMNETLPDVVYEFSRGTVIYALPKNKCVLVNTVRAIRKSDTEGNKNLYKLLDTASLYCEKKYISLPPGSYFIAFSKTAKKINFGT